MVFNQVNKTFVVQKTFVVNKRAFTLFFSLLFMCFCVTAQEPAGTRGAIVTSNTPADTTKGETYAIITGVSNYPGINPLKYADKDAILFREFLKTPSGGNTKPENIFMKRWRPKWCLVNANLAARTRST